MSFEIGPGSESRKPMEKLDAHDPPTWEGVGDEGFAAALENYKTKYKTFLLEKCNNCAPGGERSKDGDLDGCVDTITQDQLYDEDRLNENILKDVDGNCHFESSVETFMRNYNERENFTSPLTQSVSLWKIDQNEGATSNATAPRSPESDSFATIPYYLGERVAVRAEAVIAEATIAYARVDAAFAAEFSAAVAAGTDLRAAAAAAARVAAEVAAAAAARAEATASADFTPSAEAVRVATAGVAMEATARAEEATARAEAARAEAARAEAATARAEAARVAAEAATRAEAARAEAARVAAEAATRAEAARAEARVAAARTEAVRMTRARAEARAEAARAEARVARARVATEATASAEATRRAYVDGFRLGLQRESEATAAARSSANTIEDQDRSSSEIITDIRIIMRDALDNRNLDMNPAEYVNSFRHWGKDIRANNLNWAMVRVKKLYEILQARDRQGQTFRDYLWENADALYIIERYYTTLQEVFIAITETPAPSNDTGDRPASQRPISPEGGAGTTSRSQNSQNFPEAITNTQTERMPERGPEFNQAARRKALDAALLTEHGRVRRFWNRAETRAREQAAEEARKRAAEEARKRAAEEAREQAREQAAEEAREQAARAAEEAREQAARAAEEAREQAATGSIQSANENGNAAMETAEIPVNPVSYKELQRRVKARLAKIRENRRLAERAAQRADGGDFF